MNTNIKDVARFANVSISTVSRVINNSDGVKPETRKKVLEAIEKLNFKPNRIAQSLGSKAFPAIGFVSASRLSNESFLSLIIRSIGEVVEDRNFEILLNNSVDENREIEKCLSMIESKVVQGIICIGSKTNDLLLKELCRVNFPFVLLGRCMDENIADKIYTVNTDNINDSKYAVKYLINLGHQKIAFIHGPLQHVVCQDRFTGYIEAHKEARIPVDYSFIQDGGYTLLEAYNAALKIFRSPSRPTAIFTNDDMKAVGIYKAAKELGLKIPEDISVVGHNNYEISEVVSPSLTTIHVPVDELGTVGTQVLFDLIEGKSPLQRTVLKTSLIERDSCRRII